MHKPPTFTIDQLRTISIATHLLDAAEYVLRHKKLATLEDTIEVAKLIAMLEGQGK